MHLPHYFLHYFHLETQHMMDQGAQATLSWETGAVWPDSWGSDAKRYIKEAGKTYRAMIDAAKEQGK